MNLNNIPFGAGEHGHALWRTQQFDNIRVRIVEYSAGYLALHCK